MPHRERSLVNLHSLVLVVFSFSVFVESFYEPGMVARTKLSLDLGENSEFLSGLSLPP